MIFSTIIAQHQIDARTKSIITDFTSGSAMRNRPQMLRSEEECATKLSTDSIKEPHVTQYPGD